MEAVSWHYIKRMCSVRVITRAYSVDRNGSKPAFTDNDDHFSVFFYEDLFGRNNSPSAKSFCSTGPRAGRLQEARRDTKAGGPYDYKTSGGPNH